MKVEVSTIGTGDPLLFPLVRLYHLPYSSPPSLIPIFLGSRRIQFP